MKEVSAKATVTVEATIKRADGTVEHLGVIASSDKGNAVVAPTKRIKEGHD